ncbi:MULTISPECIES: ABC transporter permease [Pseudomonas]|jgi:sulfonate transport system permease protein|uniref:Putative aliphatic sulfonates transport permease protein SsuC n=1 Tax=Pseudomonas extremaustralis TaxID=359110 RepID=A0A5M9J118_9PSED|nr:MULTISPECIES: ABC transporter permease [Pseudomonas]KAA8561859.1 putative aliphatic sulfonates transport permease protein SsuC [Pseudomonas extremaustralis]OCW20323.1 ABC transporter permease [Pseudomonas sp. S3E12]CRM79784.1 Putative aliphatic sulfonates transport permease protein SsuC [Pseudomonas sp. 8 R 14]SAM30913.1 Putative aliphatic sulfonates transport permease protein SsuC [Pseudomonas sp. 1 R 17]SFV06414.1 sulfonate transport system permease protein [Pseudomonas sp. OV546]
MRTHRLFTALTWLISPLALLAVWTWVAHLGIFPRNLLVPPAQVLHTFEELLASGELLEHLGNSLSRLGLGFGIGSLCGLAFGVLMALSKNVEVYCGPLFHTLRQIPSIALIPMFVLLFGIDETFKIIIVAKTAFFPVALAAGEGVRGIPRSYFEVADVYRLRWPTFVRLVALPAAAPPIITGFRISLTRAWVVLVATELLAADSGLGQMIEMARQMLRIDVVMVGVVVTGVIGFALDYAFRRIEQRLFRWQTR